MLGNSVSGDFPVTLITTFHLRDDAPGDLFVQLWTEVAHLMERRPGFASARLYRASMAGETGRYIQVAQWTRASLLAAAQADPEIRSLVREVQRLVTRADRAICEPATETIVQAD